MSNNPQQQRRCCVYITAEETARVLRLIEKVGGILETARRLGVGETVFSAARDRGRMKASTHARLFAAVEREEMRQ